VAFEPLARAAVERRKASAPEARTDGNVRFRVARAASADAACRVAPFGASPPSIFWSEVLGRAFLQRGGQLGCGGIARTEEACLCPVIPRCEPTGPREVARPDDKLSEPRRATAETPGPRPSRLTPLAPQDEGHDACVASRPAPPPPRKSAAPLPHLRGGGCASAQTHQKGEPSP
jgi:hypothetical protein